MNHYTFERNNPYKYTDPTGHLAIQGGIEGSVGFLIGFSGSAGFAQSYGSSDGYQYGTYYSGGGGATTPTADIHLAATISPFVNNLAELGGKSRDFSFDIGEFLTVGAGISFPYTEDKQGNRKYDWKKFGVKFTVGPFTDVNSPIPFSGSAMDSKTTTTTLFSLGGKSGSSTNTGSSSSSTQSGAGGQGSILLSNSYKEIRPGVYSKTYYNDKGKLTTSVKYGK